MIITLKELTLENEANKIVLNTKSVMKDLSDELIDFLNYVEHSDDKTANNSNGTLVKNIHKRVLEVKNDVRMEVEYMTLTERDRENREEGRLEGILEGKQEERINIATKLLDVLDDETIALKTGISIEVVRSLRKLDMSL